MRYSADTDAGVDNGTMSLMKRRMMSEQRLNQPTVLSAMTSKCVIASCIRVRRRTRWAYVSYSLPEVENLGEVVTGVLSVANGSNRVSHAPHVLN